MNNTVLIYGHSDDLIEIEGAIREEFSGAYDDPTTIKFSDGRKFTLEYTGVWEITPENIDQDLEAIDYSKLDLLPEEALPNVTNDYSQVAVYQSWIGIDGVEVVE